MYDPAYVKIAELASRPDSVERAINYLETHIRKFLRRRERVLICFAREENTICHIFEQAVLRCGGIPMVLGEDRRWITILKTAFTSKCNAIIGPPLLLLGLGKLARYMGTPLYTRNVVLAAQAAKARGAKVIGLTGEKQGKLALLCDVLINVPDTETYRIQELHLPVYHYICAEVERKLFD